MKGSLQISFQIQLFVHSNIHSAQDLSMPTMCPVLPLRARDVAVSKTDIPGLLELIL